MAGRDDEFIPSLGVTRAQAKWLFRDRWTEVNRQEIEELQRRTPEESLRRFLSLMHTAKRLGWCERDESDEAVRQRWLALKRRGA